MGEKNMIEDRQTGPLRTAQILLLRKCVQIMVLLTHREMGFSLLPL